MKEFSQFFYCKKCHFYVCKGCKDKSYHIGLSQEEEEIAAPNCMQKKVEAMEEDAISEAAMLEEAREINTKVNYIPTSMDLEDFEPPGAGSM